jgi:hypothetical protein
VTKRSRHKGKRKKRKALPGTYESVRGPRLRRPAAPGSVAELPPSSPRALPETTVDDPAPLDEAAEEARRILAALETMGYLEPSFDDGLVGEEASVTIIERATPFDMPPPLDSAGAPREPDRAGVAHGAPKAPDVDAARHAAYHGPIEEAVVEIFEVPGPMDPTSDTSEPRPKEGRSVAHRRPSKTLTDGGRG